MKGNVFDFPTLDGSIKEAILTKTKFACDYNYDGVIYHVEATSTDGAVYRGTWGMPRLHPGQNVELTRFEGNNNEIVLIGPWDNAAEHDHGMFLFRLKP